MKQLKQVTPLAKRMESIDRMERQMQLIGAGRWRQGTLLGVLGSAVFLLLAYFITRVNS